MVLGGNVMGMRLPWSWSSGAGRSRRSTAGGGTVAAAGAMAAGAHGGYIAEPQKMALVNRIKAFQRLGEDQKALWGTHCDSHLGGVRDPMRHDHSALQAFCSKNRVP